MWMFPKPAVVDSFPTPEIQLKELWANFPNNHQASDVNKHFIVMLFFEAVFFRFLKSLVLYPALKEVFGRLGHKVRGGKHLNLEKVSWETTF